MGNRRVPGGAGAAEVAGKLDALLAKHTERERVAQESPAVGKEQSPIEEMRQRFAEKLIPLTESIAECYRPKGISVSLDASDFLQGGRGVRIDITFGDHRLVLDGTALPEAIAFNETRQIRNRGGTVSGGPMLRGARLTEDGFAKFLYDRIISLVREATDGSVK